MQRYPGTKGSMAQLKGIRSYGRTKHLGYSVLKVPRENIDQLTSIGYKYVGSGNSYAYVVPPH